MREAEMEWYWEDLWTGKRYWESKGVTYLVYIEDGCLKLKEVQSSKPKANESG